MSNYIGYTESDNIRRKSNNIEGQEISKTMQRTKKYGGSGPSAAIKEANKMRVLSRRNPVKIFTKEEIEAHNRR